MPLLKAGLLSAAMLVAVAGCATKQDLPLRTTACNPAALGSGVVGANGVLAAQVPGSFSPIPLDQVQILDANLAQRLMVQAALAGRSPTQTMHVQARVVNCTSTPMQIEGRTHFISLSGATAEPISAWKRIYIPATGLGVYEENSLTTTQADRYLIELREAK